jgi:TIR domain
MNTDYDVAISFAGEDRKFARTLADEMKKFGIRVFLDEDEQEKLWGIDNAEFFSELFLKRTEFCLMLVSKHYAKKPWTTLERRAALARAMTERGAYVLPVRLDDTELPGLLPTIGYLDSRKKSAEVIVGLLLKVLRAKLGDARVPYKVLVQDVFNRAPIKIPSGGDFADSMFTTACPTCGERQNLNDCNVVVEDSNTVYYCKNGCQRVAVVSSPSGTSWPGRGYRLGDFVIRNAENIFCKLPNGVVPILIPKSSAALKRET